jgi:hypothetical protein
VELEERYCEVAVKRLMQTVMVFPEEPAELTEQAVLL